MMWVVVSRIVHELEAGKLAMEDLIEFVLPFSVISGEVQFNAHDLKEGKQLEGLAGRGEFLAFPNRYFP